MSWRRVPCLKVALLSAAAFLLLSPLARAGKQSTAPTWPPPYHPRPVPVVVGPTAPVTLSVAVTPSVATKEVVSVNLRGPDGQVRRFAVEGGREAIQSPRVIVLRPGSTVTIRWAVAK